MSSKPKNSVYMPEAAKANVAYLVHIHGLGASQWEGFATLDDALDQVRLTRDQGFQAQMYASNGSAMYKRMKCPKNSIFVPSEEKKKIVDDEWKPARDALSKSGINFY